MSTFLLSIFIAVSVLAIVLGFLLVLHTWEHRRYTRNKLRQGDSAADVGTEHVTVIVPCKGIDLRLEENVQRLLSQDYTDYEVLFVVDSDKDAACDIIRDAMSKSPARPARLIVSGEASNTGQKIHNLLAALGELDDNTEIVAFVDSDARPNRNWLRNLISNLNRPGFDVVTSYRWFVPLRVSLGNLIMCSINSAVMALTASRRPTVLWGGTWAIRRDMLDQSGLRFHWRGVLSDDLAASRLFDQLGMKVSYEPRCTILSPINYHMPQMWEFLRRQIYMGRWYRTRTWWLCFANVTATVIAFWVSVFAAAVGMRSEADWTFPVAGVALSLFGLSVVRAAWRQQAGKLYSHESTSPSMAAQVFDLFAFPLTMTIVWAGMLTTINKRRTEWRGIQYEVRPGGQIESLHHLSQVDDEHDQRSRQKAA